MRRWRASELLSLKGCVSLLADCHGMAETSTYLAASLTLMGLFTSVDPLMDRESGPLNELLPAALKVTHMGTDAAVNSFCREVSGQRHQKEAVATYRDARDHCVSQSLSRTCCTDTPLVLVGTGGRLACRPRGALPETCPTVVCCGPCWAGGMAGWGPCWHWGPGAAGRPWRWEKGTTCSWGPSSGNALIRGGNWVGP